MRRAAPEIAVAYVEAYARASDYRTDDIFAWLPFVAAARLAEVFETKKMNSSGWLSTYSSCRNTPKTSVRFGSASRRSAKGRFGEAP